jgi:hypothetical protein
MSSPPDIMDLESTPTHHWSITFELLLDKDKVLPEGDPEAAELVSALIETDYWVTDSVVVAGNEDARPCIDLVEAYVMNVEKYDEYPLPAIGFRLTGIELLSVAEI